MAAALEELDAFGSAPGKAALVRETSAQHFAVPSGDYFEAVRKDSSLVLAPKGGRGNSRAGVPKPSDRPSDRSWAGPSMCAKMEEDAPPHPRNAILRELMATRRYRHVRLLRFEALTQPRWDFHASVKWSAGSWKSDCTHWCYSQCMWDLHWHDLVQALRQTGLTAQPDARGGLGGAL
uniref:Uncharacterized protein n=1 Tax=Haptolina brevifila TaxID=156173 RepID=A0A7S2B7X3_9EUKA